MKVAVLLRILIALTCSLIPWFVQASEQWPPQPYTPPRMRNDERWPGDIEAAKLMRKDGFCAASGIVYAHHNVMRGGILAAPQGTLFFPKRTDLDLFESPQHAIGRAVRFIPISHPMRALEDISSNSDIGGARVQDEIFGQGFIRWPRNSDERFPDWRELWHGNDGGVCGNHDFVHYPTKFRMSLFHRPKWDFARSKSSKRVIIERDF